MERANIDERHAHYQRHRVYLSLHLGHFINFITIEERFFDSVLSDELIQNDRDVAMHTFIFLRGIVS